MSGIVWEANLNEKLEVPRNGLSSVCAIRGARVLLFHPHCHTLRNITCIFAFGIEGLNNLFMKTFLENAERSPSEAKILYAFITSMNSYSSFEEKKATFEGF